ncbi:S8 family serine peptidase [Lentzea flava]|uniref:Serine protease n=1 Tax=Lentzea flava TaxID=103732 RepID=A0ABQ2V6X0_9PSEU|nr:S8 family serine peptidase [Lentzea flava]MCP2203372.1 Subtilase family protein [Lentzea flava]GGU68402.1 serine protease [Lentzea flava]
MRIRALSAVVALALTTVPAVASAADSPHATANEITLVTGDQVSLGPDGTVTAIKPGEGRTGITFRTHRRPDGHTLVIPSDAAAPLAANRLDQRLFDVTSLQEFGYRDRTPLLVGGSPRLAAGDWSSLKNSADKVWLDGLRQPSLDRSVKQIGAPAAHAAGLTGKGVKIAVVDTGVDHWGPDLWGREIASRNFTSEPDMANNAHGTHVAATIVSGHATYGGVAPGARILDAKVCQSSGCPDSAIISGLRWAVEQGAQIVNVSLGGPDGPEIDPVEQEINTLTAEYGTLFVVAAGNDGRPGTINSPGSAEAALTVGAVDREDQLAPFSSQGPKTGARGSVKPEVTAPGVDIVAAKAGSYDHIAMSGTSMATPHVTGAAALLKQQHPEWTASQLKAALAATAKPTTGLTPFQQGAGRIDVAKAITQRVVADAATLDLGTHVWPREDDTPTTKQITYTNTADADITLDLTLDSAARVFSLSTNSLIVPAKGTATVRVTGDPRAASADGVVTGEVVATSGDQRVRTLIGLDREPESYTLRLDHTGYDGQNPASGLTIVTGLDVPHSVLLDATRDHVLRLPKGTYLIDSKIDRVDPAGRTVTGQLVHPGVRLTRDETVAIDVRETQPVSLTAPGLGTSSTAVVAYQRTFDGVPARGSISVRDGRALVRTKQLGSPVPEREFSSLVSLDATTATPGTFYRVAHQVPGFPTGFVRESREEEFARVETTIGSVRPDSLALKGETARTSLGVRGETTAFEVPHGQPAVDLVTTENVRWESTAAVIHSNVSATSNLSPSRSYQAGRSYRESEVRPVFGPGLPEHATGRRTGTSVVLAMPLLSDGNHGAGVTTTDELRTALYVDDVLAGESTFFTNPTFTDLPARDATFRVERSFERGTKFELSTRVSAVWTFRSAATARETALPLSVVRFEPKLDANGALPAGTLQRLGLLTQSQGDTGELRDLRVEYSFDDGASWRRAGISGASALIYHPADAKYASLRAAATDSKGNSFEVTIIRAYRVTAGS